MYSIHDGNQIREFAKAAEGIGQPGLRFQDMRRSCARNLVRAGVPERIAMDVTGHLTRKMFDRYNISSEADLEAAMEKVTQYNATHASAPSKVVALRKAS